MSYATVRGRSSIRSRTDSVIVKAPAVNLSYLQLVASYGTPLSSKSSVQHIQTKLDQKNHDLVIIGDQRRAALT